MSITKNIHQKYLEVTVNLNAPKDKYNSFGKYHYRSAEGILEAIKPLLNKVGATVTIVEDIMNTGEGGNIIMSKAIMTCTESGESVSAVAFAGIEKAGGMALPQAYGSASSYAKKYALGNLFLIDDTADADATNDHGKGGTMPSPAGGGLPSLTPSHKNWKAARDLVKANPSKLDAIKKQYKLTPANEKKLLA